MFLCFNGWDLSLSVRFTLFSVILTNLHRDYLPGFSTMDYEKVEEFEKLLYILAYDVVATIFPVIIVSFCYFKAYKFLKAQMLSTSYVISSKSPRKMLIYSFIPIICLCPDVFAEIAYMYHLHNSTILMLVTDILRRSWALVNLWMDWSLASNDKGRSDSVSSTGSCFELDMTTVHSESLNSDKSFP